MLQAVAAVKAAEGKVGIGAVELQLLLGKVFAQWRGHTNDALAVYDSLVKVQNPRLNPRHASSVCPLQCCSCQK